MKYFWLGIQKFAEFDGRANRKEYWNFFLFYSIVGLVTIMFIPKVAAIFCLFCLIPNLAVTARRLHDVGLSGWWSLAILIPLGWLGLLFALVKKGDLEENKYGSPSFA